MQLKGTEMSCNGVPSIKIVNKSIKISEYETLR